MSTVSEAPAVEFGALDFQRLESMKARGFDPHCVFDVGASNAGWSRVIYPLFPDAEYHLFEPLVDKEPQYAVGMDAFVDAHPNVSLHRTAVGEASGTIKFSYVKGQPDGSTAIPTRRSSLFKKIKCPVVTLDEVIARGASVPDLVKMDIQGGELSALKGLSKNLGAVQVLLLETWLSRGYGDNTPLLHEIYEFLIPFGFRMFDVGEVYRIADGTLMTQDFFFVNRNSPFVSDLRY